MLDDLGERIFLLDRTKMIKPGRYRHFKGQYYEVLGAARDSETLQELVVYRALYGERGLWVRPLAMFTSQVERDGKTMARFAYVGDADRE